MATARAGQSGRAEQSDQAEQSLPGDPIDAAEIDTAEIDTAAIDAADQSTHADQSRHTEQSEGGGPEGERGRSGELEKTTQEMIREAIGGPRGLVDSGLPALVFVVANAIGGLKPAIISAVATGIVLVVVRLLRKETLQQAIAGFFGVALAVIVAARTGNASGFFLPGILYQGLLAVLSVVSLVVGRPYVGYVLAAVDPKYAHWRESRGLRRAMAVATVLWGFIFLVRAIVQGLLYVSDHVGWLATAKIAMGWPLFAAGLAVTYWLARRAEHGTRSESPV